MSEAVHKAMSMDEVKRATLDDKTLQAVAEFTCTDCWHEAVRMYDLDTTAVRRFAKVKEELTVSDDKAKCCEAHESCFHWHYNGGHWTSHTKDISISKTKTLIRTNVWFLCIKKRWFASVCPGKP